MNIRAYCRVSAIIFIAVALAHLARLIDGSSIMLNGEAIPMVASWLGLIVTGGLAVWGFRESARVG